MSPLSCEKITTFCNGKIIRGEKDKIIKNVSIDTRSIDHTDTFLAIKGDNFDGHNFLQDAYKNGVRSFIVSETSKLSTIEDKNVSIIKVDDTLKALQNLAKNYNSNILKNQNFQSICVTGSNGKTTTKDLLVCIFSQSHSVNGTIGNLNNHIGLPLSILKSSKDNSYGIFEIGMNHVGEINFLSDILKPDYAIITNIGSAHLEHMKTKDAIAREKASVMDFMKRGSFIALYEKDEYFDFLNNYAKERGIEVISVGLENSDIYADLLESDNENIIYKIDVNNSKFSHSDLDKNNAQFNISIKKPFKQLINNYLLAIGIALKLNISIQDIIYACKNCKFSAGRVDVYDIDDVKIIDDSYNANPDSMKTGLNTLVSLSKDSKSRSIAVLGYMAEMGEHFDKVHLEVGKYCADLNVNILITFGEKASIINSSFKSNSKNKLFVEKNFNNYTEAGKWLFDNKLPNDVYLFKGSRSAKIEDVLREFKKHFV